MESGIDPNAIGIALGHWLFPFRCGTSQVADDVRRSDAEQAEEASLRMEK